MSVPIASSSPKPIRHVKNNAPTGMISPTGTASLSKRKGSISGCIIASGPLSSRYMAANGIAAICNNERRASVLESFQARRTKGETTPATIIVTQYRFDRVVKAVLT
jgi:hypothetical protein